MQFPPPVPASGRESFILLVLLARGTHFYYEISPVFLIIFTHWICNVYWIWGVVKLLPWRKSSIMVLIDRKALHEISLKKIYNVSTAQFWPQSVLKNHLILSLQQLTPLRMKGGLFFLLSDRLGRWQSFPGLKYTADMKGHCTERHWGSEDELERLPHVQHSTSPTCPYPFLLLGMTGDNYWFALL